MKTSRGWKEEKEVESMHRVASMCREQPVIQLGWSKCGSGDLRECRLQKIGQGWTGVCVDALLECGLSPTGDRDLSRRMPGMGIKILLVGPHRGPWTKAVRTWKQEGIDGEGLWKRRWGAERGVHSGRRTYETCPWCTWGQRKKMWV